MSNATLLVNPSKGSFVVTNRNTIMVNINTNPLNNEVIVDKPDDDNSEELNKLKEQLRDSQAKVNELQIELNALNTQLEHLESDKKALQDANNNLTSENTELTNQINDLDSQITQLRESIDNLNKEIIDKENTIKILNDKLTVSNGQVTSLENNITELNNQINELNEDISNLNSRINSLTINVTNLQNQLNEANETITQRDNTISELNNRLEELENDSKIIINSRRFNEGLWNNDNFINSLEFGENFNFTRYMFYYTTINKELPNWDLSNVINCDYMFYYTTINKELPNWDLSNVNSLNYMFNSATINKELPNWDLSNVNSLNYMFNSATINKELPNWDLSNVINCDYMFNSATINNNQSIKLYSKNNNSNSNKQHLFTSMKIYNNSVFKASIPSSYFYNQSSTLYNLFYGTVCNDNSYIDLDVYNINYFISSNTKLYIRGNNTSDSTNLKIRKLRFGEVSNNLTYSNVAINIGLNMNIDSDTYNDFLLNLPQLESNKEIEIRNSVELSEEALQHATDMGWTISII